MIKYLNMPLESSIQLHKIITTTVSCYLQYTEDCKMQDINFMRYHRHKLLPLLKKCYMYFGKIKLTKLAMLTFCQHEFE